jgi:heme exporter protein A
LPFDKPLFMVSSVIEGRGLGRRFAGVVALADVDLTVRSGEAVALFGPNGAGKTTLLRVLGTLLRPTHGVLRLFGTAVAGGGVAAQRRIGFLGHKSFLYPDLTPTENLYFYARMFGIRTVAERSAALLERVGLLGWAHRPVRTLSRGLEQRCALARVLLHDPDLLFLDEPFTGLDADAAGMLSDALHEVHQEGKTLVLVTHNQERGFELATRAVLLSRGRLLWDGPADDSQRESFTLAYAAAAEEHRSRVR